MGMIKGVGPMTVQSLLKIIQKFEKTGSFDLQSGRGREKIDSTVDEEVATAVQEELSGGVKTYTGIARTLDRPVSKVHKLLRNILHCYPYKISHVQELFPSDIPATETCFKISCWHGNGRRVDV